MGKDGVISLSRGLFISMDQSQNQTGKQPMGENSVISLQCAILSPSGVSLLEQRVSCGLIVLFSSSHGILQRPFLVMAVFLLFPTPALKCSQAVHIRRCPISGMPARGSLRVRICNQRLATSRLI